MKPDIRIDKKQIKKILALMGNIKNGVPMVMVKAINATLDKKQ